jgi:hypothetical protein
VQYIVNELFVRRLGWQVAINPNPNITGPNLQLTHNNKTIELTLHPIFNLNNKPNNFTYLPQPVALPNTQNLLREPTPNSYLANCFYYLSLWGEYEKTVTETVNKQPWVDLWTVELGQVLENYFDYHPINKPKYKYIQTCDVDLAYQFKGRGFWRTLGSSAVDFIKADWKNIAVRSKVLQNKIEDPFLQKQAVWENEFISHLFIPAGKNAQFDRHVQPSYKPLARLIKNAGLKNRIGLHPTVNSFENAEKLQTEKDNLERIAQQKITKSRQHYLKFSTPLSFELLASIGITEEYSLGYNQACGFRAATCHPFQFFNTLTNQPSGLCFYPLIWMDSAHKYFLKNTYAQGQENLSLLQDICKKVNGHCISNQHNNLINGW